MLRSAPLLSAPQDGRGGTAKQELALVVGVMEPYEVARDRVEVSATRNEARTEVSQWNAALGQLF